MVNYISSLVNYFQVDKHNGFCALECCWLIPRFAELIATMINGEDYEKVLLLIPRRAKINALIVKIENSVLIFLFLILE